VRRIGIHRHDIFEDFTQARIEERLAPSGQVDEAGVANGAFQLLEIVEINAGPFVVGISAKEARRVAVRIKRDADDRRIGEPLQVGRSIEIQRRVAVEDGAAYFLVRRDGVLRSSISAFRWRNLASGFVPRKDRFRFGFRLPGQVCAGPFGASHID
jgi:hypothetical protein